MIVTSKDVKPIYEAYPIEEWERTLDEAFDCLSGNWYLDIDGAEEPER